ncbi:MAG: nucleotide-binding protein [Bacteroidales bacterium]|nr:nucleotide-binding protein [Bacteroidales bacterium]
MTRKQIREERPRTVLIIARETFKSKLIEQISQGKQLESVNIQTEGQLKKNEKDFGLWNDYNEEFLKSAFNNPTNEYRHDYENTGSMIGVDDVMRGANIYHPSHRLKTLKQQIEAKTTELESILIKADLIPSEIEKTPTTETNNSKSMKVNSTVFIIHGHDEEMKRNVQLFLNRANLKDIVLHEQPDKNRTVIEKLIEEGATASYVIALLSPDDVQGDGTFRARQNVILEIGFFIGKLGRKKVRILRRGNTIIPSDLQGILYDNYDKDGAWRMKLSKEIKSVGIPINIDNLIDNF